MTLKEPYYSIISAIAGVTDLPNGILDSDAVNVGQLNAAIANIDLTDYYTKVESDGKYIFASPTEAQPESIWLNGNIEALNVDFFNTKTRTLSVTVETEGVGSISSYLDSQCAAWVFSDGIDKQAVIRFQPEAYPSINGRVRLMVNEDAANNPSIIAYLEDLADYSPISPSGSYIQASPVIPQDADINISGSINSTVNASGDAGFLYFKNTNSAGNANIILEAGGNPAFIYNNGSDYLDNPNTLTLWNYNEASDAKITFRVNGSGLEEDLFSILKGGAIVIGTTPLTTTAGYHTIVRDDATGELMQIAGGGGEVSSVFGRTGVITAQSSDYSSFYYPLTGNPSGFLTSFTESDPTVPSYAKSLTAFSVIKTSTDALYEPIFSKNTAFNKDFGASSGSVAEGNDSRITNGQTAFGWGNHASAGYQLVSNLQTNLTASSTKYPSVNAVNTGLALKANLLNGNNFTGVQKTDQYWGTLVPTTGTQDVSKLSLGLNSGAGRAVGTLFLNTTSLDGITGITTGILQAPAAQTANWVWTMPNKTGTIATTLDIPTALSLTTIGTSGAATFDPATGILNIPNYATGGGSLPTLTAGSVVFSDGTTLAQDNTNFFWNNTTKRLSIGGNSAYTPLQVMHNPAVYTGGQFVGNSPSTDLLADYPALALINTNTTANNYAGLEFYDSDNPAVQWPYAGIKGIFTTHGTSLTTSRGDIAIITNGADGYLPRMRITSGGLVNISGLTISQAVLTDASKNLVSVALTGSGNIVRATAPTLVTPVLGVATATSINKLTITAPTTSSTLTIVQGSSLITVGAFALTLTSTAATNATFPAGTGTLIYTTAVAALIATAIKDTNIALTANTTLTAASWGTSGQLTIYANCTTGNITITLPAASAVTGLTLNVKRLDGSANGITISGASIDSTTSANLSTINSAITLKSNGTQYYIF